MKKKKRMVRRRKKELRRRKHYLDEAPLQSASSVVYFVRRTDNGGVDSDGCGNERLFIFGSDVTLSEAIWGIHRTLGEGAKFKLEQVISGHFHVRPTTVFSYFNRDGRIFNEKMDVIGKAKQLGGKQ